MNEKINISNLTPEQHQALACMYFAKLPSDDPRYKQRNKCFKIFQKRFNKKINTYKNAKDTYDAYFDTNNRVGWKKDNPISSRGAEYQEIYDLYKDYDVDELEEAVEDIIKLYDIFEANYVALRLKDPQTVHGILEGDKEFTIDQIADLQEDLIVGKIIFIALGGDKSKKEVDWETGLYAIAHVIRSPFDIGYKKSDKKDYFKFDMKIDITLDEPISRSSFLLYYDTYDAPYIGIEINRDRTQAISQLEDNKAIAIIRATIEKMPHLKEQLADIFPKEFMERVYGNAVIFSPTNVKYGQDLKEAIYEQLTETDQDTNIDPYTKDDFLDQVYIDSTDYDLIVSMLKIKKNIILQGAPGVGKTFMAKRLAYSIIGYTDDSKVEMVQFHQSYSFEDFVVGYRPSKEGFSLEYGPFYKFCEKAKSEPGPHFFIIDEINRGNVSKIFGELLMLIEEDKRGENIDLLYSKEPFYVPENIYIIGLMNTADKSLALIDYALRRRFAFYDVKPAFDKNKFKADMRKKANPDQINRLVKYVKELNKIIRKDDSLGPGFEIGHSYFCKAPELGDSAMDTNQWMDMTVEYELIPLIKEYWFDDPDKVDEGSKILRGKSDND